MKQSLIRRLTSCTVLAGGILLTSAPALAAGVTAGTLIENTASASYNTGTATKTIDSNKVTIKVDEVLDVAVASLDSGAIPIAGSSSLSFSVTNTGNGPETFALTADPAIAGNAFDTTVNSLAIDTNGNGVYDAGVDALLANGGTSPSIAPDGTLKVFVLVTAPAGTTDGQTSQVKLTAAASTGTGSPGTTFAGAGTNGSDAVVGSSGASASALGSLAASVANVALVKSATVLDPFGGSQPVPGATITYQIVATVSGSGSIDALTITDAIPASTTYQAGTLTLESTALTDASDADAGTASAAGISVNAGNVAAGSTRTVKFKVKVN